MRTETTDVETAAVLESQADSLTRRAEALRAQAADLSREAARMRADADRIRKPEIWGPVPLISPHARKARSSDDAAFMSCVVDELSKREHPATSTDLADALNVSQQRLRDCLLRLEAIGQVVRTGLSRGTRWSLPAEPDEPAPAPTPIARPRSLESTIRDAAKRLDVFTFDEIAAELSDVSSQTLRRWLPKLEAKGTLYAETIGGRKLYEYAKPKSDAPQNRPRRATPEQEAVRAFGSLAVDRRIRGDGPVSGRRVKTGNKRSDQTVAAATKAGAKVRIKANQHVEVTTPDGQRIGLALTPGRASAKRDREKLRRAGLRV